MEFRKMVMMTLYARQQKRHKCVERTFGLWGEGEYGMTWENGIETCILSCKKWITSLCSIQDTGCLGLVHRDDPERWCGVGGERGSRLGTHVHPWQIHVTVWQNQYSIVKQNKVKIKIKEKKADGRTDYLQALMVKQFFMKTIIFKP